MLETTKYIPTKIIGKKAGEMSGCVGKALTPKSRAAVNSDTNREAKLTVPTADGSGDFVRQPFSHESGTQVATPV